MKKQRCTINCWKIVEEKDGKTPTTSYSKYLLCQVIPKRYLIKYMTIMQYSKKMKTKTSIGLENMRFTIILRLMSGYSREFITSFRA